MVAAVVSSAGGCDIGNEGVGNVGGGNGDHGEGYNSMMVIVE